ncbi:MULTISPECIES: type I-B CRISPR-associated endonuclease Cas1b [Acidiplasma]|nr:MULTISPECIES: type I-B CRISPR-associated endonuclease Cas1b [Acidiplasma]WMT55282.1 MAG: type I-B CRISPR-associated endonuclease Cas1b [Acidiplasma sp.]
MGETYYILQSGSLSKVNESVVFQNQNEKSFLPIENIDEILVFGNLTITTPVLQLLSKKNIPVFLYSHYGWYISSIIPEDYLQSGYVITHQAAYYNNPDLRLKLARSFVLGAAKNMAKLCKRLRIGNLRVPVNEISKAVSISELMGIEGNIHIKYLELLDLKLPQDFKVISRSRMPPRNYINSMMSYLYSVLYGIIGSQIFSTHLSPSISFLHEPSERRSSLSLDIAEIFRPVFCDRVILKLINLKIMKKSDFIDDNGIYLNEAGKRKVLVAFEEKLRETVYVSSLRRKVSNKFLIRLEIYKVEKQIMENKQYKPYIMRD